VAAPKLPPSTLMTNAKGIEMLQSLRDRKDLESAIDRATQISIEQKCIKYVSYVARNDVFKISDWYDDATILSISNGSMTTY
jgi:hypothetical protein